MLQRFLPLLAACGCLAIAFALTAHAQQPPGKKDPAKLQFEFDDGAVMVNRTKLTLPIERKDLIRLLGTPSRELPQANTLLIWDELGILAYQRPNSEKIRGLQLTLDREAIQDRPKKRFAGSVKVEGAAVTAEATLIAINRAIKPRAFVKEENLSNVLHIGYWIVEYRECVLFLREAEPRGKSERANFSSLQLDQKDDQ